MCVIWVKFRHGRGLGILREAAQIGPLRVTYEKQGNAKPRIKCDFAASVRQLGNNEKVFYRNFVRDRRSTVLGELMARRFALCSNRKP